MFSLVSQTHMRLCIFPTCVEDSVATSFKCLQQETLQWKFVIPRLRIRSFKCKDEFRVGPSRLQAFSEHRRKLVSRASYSVLSRLSAGCSRRLGRCWKLRRPEDPRTPPSSPWGLWPTSCRGRWKYIEIALEEEGTASGGVWWVWVASFIVYVMEGCGGLQGVAVVRTGAVKEELGGCYSFEPR